MYNVYDSGLFYRMGPSRTFLRAEWNRAETLRTSIQKQNNHITIVLCVNDDGSHKYSAKYIGKSKAPIALKDPIFESLKSQYSSQSNGWKDRDGFDEWIEGWRIEKQKIFSGPW